MATDRYSDDHKIVVGGGSGTLTVDAVLDINGGLDVAGNLDVTGGLDVNGNLTVPGGLGDVLLSPGLGDIILSPGIGDIFLSSDNGIIEVIAAGGVTISSSSSDISISAYDDLNLFAGEGGSTGFIKISPSGAPAPTYGSVYITLSESDDEIKIGGPILDILSDSVLITSDSVAIDSDDITITSNYIETTGIDNAASVFSMENTSSNSNADILVLRFPNVTTPGGGNNWIIFRAQDPSDPLLNTTRGAIQGASNSYGDYYAIVSSSEINPLAKYAKNGNNNPFNTSLGYVQFVTGSSDFGEWIELGEPSEWGIDSAKEDKYKRDRIFPIEEGALLYVRGGMAYKAGEGTPMIITHRAALVGNKTYDDNKNLGVILSFVGQVPVIVEGPVKDGDYLIPKLGENYCTAIAKSQITFEQYRSCIGTAWGNSDESGMSKVNCAIGIK
jgi:hypothetical protein